MGESGSKMAGGLGCQGACSSVGMKTEATCKQTNLCQINLCQDQLAPRKRERNVKTGMEHGWNCNNSNSLGLGRALCKEFRI